MRIVRVGDSCGVWCVFWGWGSVKLELCWCVCRVFGSGNGI